MPLRIIENDNLDRQVRLQFEAITGKILVQVMLAEAVTNGIRRSLKKLPHPLFFDNQALVLPAKVHTRTVCI